METRITVKPETRLERHVRAWLNGQVPSYDSNSVEDVLRDLAHGCSSGMVSHLVYFADTTRFFARHRSDISALLARAIEDSGETPEAIFGDKWDRLDPLAQEKSNQNLLAWFGFEEAARDLATRQGIEV